MVVLSINFLHRKYKYVALCKWTSLSCNYLLLSDQSHTVNDVRYIRCEELTELEQNLDFLHLYIRHTIAELKRTFI